MSYPMASASKLTDIDTVAKNPVLTRRFEGRGEFIYLQGVASTVAGDLVVYDELGVTTRAVAAASGPCAVAMAAVLAGQFGWYQIFGNCAVLNTAGAVADNAKLFLTATPGQVDDAVVIVDVIVGAIARSAVGGAGSIVAQLNYPNVGQAAVS